METGAHAAGKVVVQAGEQAVQTQNADDEEDAVHHVVDPYLNYLFSGNLVISNLD